MILCVICTIYENHIYTYKLLYIFSDCSPIEPLCNDCLSALLPHMPSCCPIPMDIIKYHWERLTNVSLSHNIPIQLFSQLDKFSHIGHNIISNIIQ